MPQRARRPLWKTLRRVVPAILLAILGTYALSRMGTLHGIERLILNVQIAGNPRPTSDIAIVAINDADFYSLFNGQRPLDPKRLESLIDAIAQSRPAAIGIDIDTSDPRFDQLEVDPAWPPVVWAREIHPALPEHGQEIEALDVLGGQDPAFNGRSGIPALRDDPEDKVTRLYSICIETKTTPVRSFVAAVVAAYRPNADADYRCGDNASQHTRLRYINYSLPTDALYAVSAGAVMKTSDDVEAGGRAEPIAELAGKIVLVGGTFIDVDNHDTPIGEMRGVAILANAIQTELDGGGAFALPRWTTFLLEFTAGALLVLALHFWSPSPLLALILGVTLTGVISLAFSMVSFDSVARVANFAPTLLAVLLVEIYEHARESSLLRATAGREEHAKQASPDARP